MVGNPDALHLTHKHMKLGVPCLTCWQIRKLLAPHHPPQCPSLQVVHVSANDRKYITFRMYKMGNKKLRTLDLFSGIGGFSLALKDIARTVAYCEIDSACRDILTARMRDNGLEKAPIFHDITTLSAQDLHELSPELITAGFPCQDITPINRTARGIMGARSRLVFDVFRLVRSVKTMKYVVLENSANIVNMGLARILKEFSVLGWTVTWGVFSSLEVGCFHDRRRWVCLACATGMQPPTRPLTMRHVPDNKSPTKLTTTSKSNTIASMALGNAVVPAMMAHAFTWLCNMHAGTAELTNTGALCGACLAGKKTLHHRKIHSKTKPLNLIFKIGGVEHHKRYWGTPTRRRPCKCQKNTSNLRHLSCQVQLERQSRGDGVINARFVEWLMGFPPRWTVTHQNCT